MRPPESIERLIKKLRYKASAETHDRVLGNVLQALDKCEGKKPGATAPNIWRTIMKSRITQIATAAAIIIAVLVGLHFVGNPLAPTVTWAQIIQPILNARTASLDILIGSEGNQSVIHDDVMGSRIRRTVSNIEGPDIIIDLEQQKMLIFEHAAKTAVFIELAGLDNIENYLELLRNSVLRLQDSPEFYVEEQGIQTIEGRDYIVFVAESEEETITIWADPKTALPIRIEQKTPNMQIICDNLQFDVVLDESRFSMEVPDDYTIKDAGIDFGKNSESDFIETLRIWAEIIEDGYFPDSISLEDVVKIGPKFDQGLKRAGLTEKQQIEIATKWGQGFVFIRFFKGQGQWHYAGQGVKLGESGTPIFWYQPEDSETYRVIYGDLHVEDVAEQDLPEPEPALSEKQAKIIRSSEQWQEQEFVGSEKDIWHITASGDIVAHSHITLTKMPQNAGVMYINLPYSGAVLESVILDDKEVPFSIVATAAYELELPAENLLEGVAPVECTWSMPLEALVKVDYGYRINLQGLIPVEGFALTVVLEPDCGFEYTKDPSKTQMIPFSGNFKSPEMHFGSCGLLMKKRK